MKHYILAASLTFTSFAACSGQNPAEQTGAVTRQVVSAQGGQVTGKISISNPYVLPPFPGRDVGAGFFELQNNGAADRLISASSPDSAAVEIHNHIEDDGVMRMRKVESVALETGDVIRFEPGSYHLMLFGVNLKEGQENIDVTLNYETAGPVTLTVPIRQHGDDGDEDEEESKGSGSHFGSGTKSGDNRKKKKAYGSGQ